MFVLEYVLTLSSRKISEYMVLQRYICRPVLMHQWREREREHRAREHRYHKEMDAPPSLLIPHEVRPAFRLKTK